MEVSGKEVVVEKNVEAGTQNSQENTTQRDQAGINFGDNVAAHSTEEASNDCVLSNAKSVDPHCGDSKKITEENEPIYITPCEDPYEKAWKYLSKHNILHLFQGITANVFYNRPSDPLEAMIQQIEKIQEEDRQRKGVIKRTEITNNSNNKL